MRQPSASILNRSKRQLHSGKGAHSKMGVSGRKTKHGTLADVFLMLETPALQAKNTQSSATYQSPRQKTLFR